MRKGTKAVKNNSEQALDLYAGGNNHGMKKSHNIKKRKLIAILVVTLIILILIFIVLFIYFEQPERVIARKTGLTLSENDDVINYDRVYFDHGIADSAYAKLKINEAEKDNIIKQLEDEKILPLFNGNSDDYRFIHNLYDWFLIDESDIVYLFQSYRTDRKFRDKGFHNIWIIITNESNCYYLYIAI